MTEKRFPAVSFIIAALLFLNAASLINSVNQYKRYDLIARRSQLIHGLKPQLAELENHLWGIISVYDPRQGRKVGLEELEHAQMLVGMTQRVVAAEALAGSDQPLVRQLGIIGRSVKALNNRLNAIKDRLDMKKMDEETAETLFPGSSRVYLLSDSYVDELKELLEQIRLSRRVIEGNIGEYDELEIRNLEGETTSFSRANKRWTLVNAAAACGMLVLLAARGFTKRGSGNA